MGAGTILVVEDDPDINALLTKIVAREGFQAVPAFSGTEALLQVERATFDLVLLDMMLPGMDGPGFVGQVRERGVRTPIVVVSAKASTSDKVDMLKLGADDYVTKPFDPDEVAARIHAVLRRAGAAGSADAARLASAAGSPGAASSVGSGGAMGANGCAIGRAGAASPGPAASSSDPDETYAHRDLRLDVARRRVTLRDAEVALTAHEFDILHVLIREPDKVFSRERLYELVWKSGYYGEENAVNVHVSNIRKKLAAAGAQDEYVKTVWGIGFKLA